MPGKSTGRKSRTFGTQTKGEEVAVSARDKGIQVGTYPDLAEKAKATMQRQERSCFPKISPCSSGEVYLFIRGKKEYVRRLKNAFIRDKRVVENYGGRCLGMAEDVKRYEGDLYQGMAEQCIILIIFPNENLAVRWTQSGILKQKDFPSPDEVELFCVPVKYLPSDDLCAFQLTEMYGLQRPPSEFQEKYVQEVAKLMNARHIYNGVIATHDANRIRNCMIRPNTFVLLNCADDECRLTDFYDSKEYRQFREYRQRAVADTNTCFFTIRPVNS